MKRINLLLIAVFVIILSSAIVQAEGKGSGHNKEKRVSHNQGGEMSDLLGEVRNLNGLIEYQEGSVVSKEVIKKDTGTVTIFAFDKGQGLSEHTAPFDALVYIVDGKAEITLSGKSNLLSAGEMIIMPANDSHALKAIEKYKMLLIMIKS